MILHGFLGQIRNEAMDETTAFVGIYRGFIINQGSLYGAVFCGIKVVTGSSGLSKWSELKLTYRKKYKSKIGGKRGNDAASHGPRFAPYVRQLRTIPPLGNFPKNTRHLTLRKRPMRTC